MIAASLLIQFLLSFCFPFEKTSPAPVNPPEIPLLSKVIIDAVLCSEYSYNDANQVIEERSKYEYIQHHYNTQHRIVSSDLYEDLSLASSSSNVIEAAQKRMEWISPLNSPRTNRRTYEYDEKGRLTRSSDNLGILTYQYDGKGRIWRQTFQQDKNISICIDFAYDRKGNVIKMSQLEINRSGVLHLLSTYEYEFDNKFNPYRAFKSLMIPGKNTNYNNITKEIYTVYEMVDHPGGEKQIKKYSYEYNDKGYPVTMNKTTAFIYNQFPPH